MFKKTIINEIAAKTINSTIISFSFDMLELYATANSSNINLVIYESKGDSIVTIIDAIITIVIRILVVLLLPIFKSPAKLQNNS